VALQKMNLQVDALPRVIINAATLKNQRDQNKLTAAEAMKSGIGGDLQAANDEEALSELSGHIPDCGEFNYTASVQIL